jgi:hypothetical protein
MKGGKRYAGKNIGNFCETSIISVKPVLLGMKGRIRHFLLWLLSRGEVIPFGIVEERKGYCAEKIL